jgi:hypothetical protein
MQHAADTVPARWIADNGVRGISKSDGDSAMPVI